MRVKIDDEWGHAERERDLVPQSDPTGIATYTLRPSIVARRGVMGLDVRRLPKALKHDLE
jgi:hypothetical protein